MGVISSTCKLTLSVLLLLCCVQTILGNKFSEVNRWDRNETTEIALGITEGHLISEQNIHIPKLFILGSQKCASTSLYDLFENQHSNICNRFHKETGYFDNIKSTWAGGIKQYESLLRHNETCQRFLNNSIKYQRTHNMDATPRYFDKKEVALRMYHSYSRELRAQLRFILVLREPVAREFSWYNHNVRFCTKSMHKYIQRHKTLARKVAAGEAQWDTSALCHERHCKSSCRTHAYRAVLGKEEEALGEAKGKKEANKGTCERRGSGATIGTAIIGCTRTSEKAAKTAAEASKAATHCGDTESNHGGRPACDGRCIRKGFSQGKRRAQTLVGKAQGKEPLAEGAAARTGPGNEASVIGRAKCAARSDANEPTAKSAAHAGGATTSAAGGTAAATTRTLPRASGGWCCGSALGAAGT